MPHPLAQSPNLDVLRALAVLLVLGDHVLETIADKSGLSFHPYDWYIGRLGVLLFFVHTSFVLMSSMERLKLTGGQLLRSFYIRRAFRIYPLSLLCVAIVVLLGVPALPWENFSSPSTASLVSNLLLTMNLTYSEPVLAPLWSLPLELQMYLLLPFIYLLLARDFSWVRFVTIYLLVIGAAVLLPLITSRFYGAVFGPCFMAGVLAFILCRKTHPFIAARWLIPLLGLIVLAYTVVEEAIEGIHHSALQWTVCLIVALCLPAIKQSSARLLNRCAHYIAKYSYGIYLFHCVALWAGCYQLSAPAAIQWIVALVLCIALPILSFHLIEQPAINLGARVARPVERKISQMA